MKKTKALLVIGVFVFCVVLVCSITCFLMMRRMYMPEHESVSHTWLHQKLNLTEEEERKLERIETRFAPKRAEIKKRFETAKADLAELLRKHDSYTDDVARAVRNLHRAHGDLQQLSIQHYYDMLDVLPAGKQAKLKDLATQALSQPE